MATRLEAVDLLQLSVRGFVDDPPTPIELHHVEVVDASYQAALDPQFHGSEVTGDVNGVDLRFPV